MVPLKYFGSKMLSMSPDMEVDVSVNTWENESIIITIIFIPTLCLNNNT